jgi:hypothetical protein
MFSGRRRNGAPARNQRTRSRHAEDEVVRELVEVTCRTEVLVERRREHERVRDQRSARVVADEQYRTVRRDVLEAAHLGAVIQLRVCLHARQRAPDVIGVAAVEPVERLRAVDERLPVGCDRTHALGKRIGLPEHANQRFVRTAHRSFSRG